MFAATSTYEVPALPTAAKPVFKTAWTVVGIVALMSANSAFLEMPQRLDIAAPAYISSSCTSDFRYNGNISLIRDGISVMTPELENSLLRLEEIGALKENWNGNGASAFSEELISRAKELVCGLSKQPIILPTGRDSIQMEYENEDGDYLEFELFEGDRLKMFLYTHDGVSETKYILFRLADKAVCEFYGRNL